ncbi:MAG: tRNA adenosine(34) deaminase TadA [Eubacteriales bacterium]
MAEITQTDLAMMEEALAEARHAAEADEVPVGAVLVRDGCIIARASNTRETSKCATHHAELLAIEAGCRALGGWRLPGTTLYVTLEPCPMCAGALINARVERVVYGAYDAKAGALGSVCDLNALPLNHHMTVTGGVMEDACKSVLSSYFRTKRKKGTDSQK